MNTNKVIGAEALMRWEHNERGLLGPDRFIGLSEDIGLIVNLGKWLVDEACQTIKRVNQIVNNTDFCLSINISVRQFQQDDVFKTIKNALERSGVNPSQLAIEITESILSEDTDAIILTLNLIKTMGVKIYLDDFGTGYSSLSYLKTLPFDVIKLDKIFVDEIEENGRNRILLHTMISMGKVLGKTLIAEGVEEPYQYDYLLQHGCDAYQGYLYSKAIPERDFLKLLSAEKEKNDISQQKHKRLLIY